MSTNACQCQQSFSRLYFALGHGVAWKDPSQHGNTHTHHTHTHWPRRATLKLNPPALSHKGTRINLAPIKKYVSYTTTKWGLDKKANRPRWQNCMSAMTNRKSVILWETQLDYKRFLKSTVSHNSPSNVKLPSYVSTCRTSCIDRLNFLTLLWGCWHL